MVDAVRMSDYVEHSATAKAHLAQHVMMGADHDRNIAAAQAWALLALAEAVRDVADAIRGEERRQ